MASTMSSPSIELLYNNPITITALAVAVGLIAVRIFQSYAVLPRGISKYVIDNEKANSKGGHAANVFPNVEAALKEAYPKFRQAAFALVGKRPNMWTTEMVVVPPSFVEQLKNLPEDKLSFIDAVKDQMSFEITGMAPEDTRKSDAVIKAINNHLTRHFSKVMTELDEETAFSINKYFPACDDWTDVYLGAVLPQVVSQVSGRIFVGLPLCRNEDFVKSTVTFTIDTFQAAEDLMPYPTWLKKIVSPWLKTVKTCTKQHTTMQRLLKDQLDERRAMAEQGQELPSDLMTWIMKSSEPDFRYELEHHARSQLSMSLAAIHTTAMTVTNALYDLTARPDYIAPLLEEWNQTVATEENGVISKSSIPKLKKLDSFIKESQRLSPLGPISMTRKVASDFALPDGTVLTKGSYVCVPAQAVAMDPNNWNDPESFDGFRFEKLRQQEGSENRYQFTTTGIDSLYFGHGKHACPGRFFASNEIKLIMSYIFRNYDIKFKEGQGRPPSIIAPSGQRPDYSVPVMMKRKRV